jgi:hypothetical protein
MLIDCGVIQGAKDAAVMMKQVVEDVRQTAKGRLDVVVATHEHWDHLSGFSQASEIFQKITMGEIWLAWTEQPENPRAKELKDEFGLQLNALIRAVRKWGAAGLQPLLYQSVVQVASFFGDVLSAGGVTTQDALKQLTTGPHGSIRYLTPGQEPFKVPGVDGVRVYVLGPPADAAYVKRLLPRKGEAYELRMNAARALLAALGPQGEGDDGAVDEWRRQAAPFDEYYMISTAQAQSRSDDFFRKYYGFGQDPADPWRRIDDDWLTSAGQLALDLDSWTNNTSLVLAFELVATGDVLLFAGDAQIGNWASWQDLSFSVKDAEGKTAVVTSADLLQRTVFYKVGHHASHNATLRLEGLELMKSPDLVAMIPVNEQTARAKRWNRGKNTPGGGARSLQGQCRRFRPVRAMQIPALRPCCAGP